MQNRWMDRVSAYVDGELDPVERGIFEARLAEDPELRQAVEGVQELVTRAARLGPIEPPRDLWKAIEARITAPAAPARRPATPAPRPGWMRRLAFAAAGVAMMVVSGSVGWYLHDVGTPTPDQVARIDRPVLRAPAIDGVAANLADQEQRLTENIADLEAFLALYADRLDPDTREAIADNLALIDAAIADANRALQEDPNSDFLHAHIANSMERKVRLLEDATRLASQEI